ncbi:MAG: putative sulfate exporter family transporter [Gammaproteobacteria bacterium]|nr:putative sulfate exporter family transporter [Gammaproteobacteria bacterium]
MAVNPGVVKWHSINELFAHYGDNIDAYIFQFIIWGSLFSIACRVMGIAFLSFFKSFLFLYLGSLFIFSISGWYSASSFNLEPPLVALILGLILANLIKLPEWVDASLRVEFYVKTGIVLLGATFPITLVVSAGAVAIGQATFISILGCLSIYFFSTRLFNLDKRLAAVLSVGGSVCGVSASMAIAAAVGAKKEHVYTSVTLVVAWALIMILFLPFVSKWLALPAGVAGAWIGTSEFADAAGFAAASAYGKMVGNEESAIKAFTLMKVIGRDLWIGIWALVWAFVATTIWNKSDAGKQINSNTNTNRSEIWKRFPKFVLGFFVASIIVTIVSESYDKYQFAEVVKPHLIEPINSIRSWVFIFCFFSIGLTTRFRDLKSVNLQTIIPFSMGVLINVIAGFIFSVYIFGEYWARI